MLEAAKEKNDSPLDVAKLLSSRFNIIRFEQRGCGRSTEDGNYDLQTAVDDLAQIQQHYGVDSWFIGGGANLYMLSSILLSMRVLYTSVEWVCKMIVIGQMSLN